MKLRKKNEVEKIDKDVDNEFNFSSEQDFTFVQLDKSIHDTKFKTKPTTYFKDALKRFVKSKASVTAACILGVLILAAIIVPIADKNTITMNTEILQNLPPKWFDGYNGGFLDGTGRINNITIDPATGYPAADASTGKVAYLQAGVVGGKDGIEYSEGRFNAASPTVLKYGSEGSINFFPNRDNTSNGIYSPTIFLDLNVKNTFSFTINKDATMDPTLGNNPVYQAVFFTTDENGTLQPTYKLTDKLDTYDLSSIDLTATLLEAGAPQSGLLAGSVGFVVDAKEGGRSTLYLDKVTVTQNGVVTEGNVSFSDATKLLATASDGKWNPYLNGSVSIYGSKVILGSFTYDYYAAAYSDDTAEFTSSDIQRYVNRGWMTYERSNKNGVPGKLTLTESGEIYCPIREVLKENTTSWSEVSSWSVTAVRSRYRWLYAEGYIGECAPVKFIFGTDDTGHDFFKVVFAGLLTSLELGVLATIINVVIGIIWGSIAGYFGGWTDIIMERLTEILGGMPFIVVMTLIALLLGSNFGTFLLALCLTGWIGVSGTTRTQFYRFKRREYVLASRTLGASDTRLIFRHILPNGIGTIVTGAVLMIPSVIFSEANIAYILPSAISFSGQQSFGITLSNAQSVINTQPYLIISASIVMAIIMICFNLFGNGLRDAFNPVLKGSNE